MTLQMVACRKHFTFPFVRRREAPAGICFFYENHTFVHFGPFSFRGCVLFFFGFVHCNLGLNYSCMGLIVPRVVFGFVVLGSCCFTINFHCVIDLVGEINLQKCKNVTPSQQRQHGDETWQNAKQLVVEIVKNQKTQTQINSIAATIVSVVSYFCEWQWLSCNCSIWFQRIVVNIDIAMTLRHAAKIDCDTIDMINRCTDFFS